MGCDIHAFVEYAKDGIYESQTNETLDIPRDYALFTVMALGDGGNTSELPYPPRGMPSGLSNKAKNYFFSPSEDVYKATMEWYRLLELKPIKIEEYAKGFSEIVQREFADNQLLLTPELHSHSWLTLDELKEVLKYGKLSQQNLSKQFWIILTSMETLAEIYSSKNVRIVFCFDGAG